MRNPFKRKRPNHTYLHGCTICDATSLTIALPVEHHPQAEKVAIPVTVRPDGTVQRVSASSALDTLLARY